MSKINTVALTKDQAIEYAQAMIAVIMSSYDEGEYISVTHNMTAGPLEAPVHFLSILPGTTKENAVRIQEGFLSGGIELNKG